MKNKYLILISGVATTFSCTQRTALDQKEDNKKENKPNIIFIMADDLGYGDLGCYGQQIIKTPNIDSMAQQGMRFTQCYSGASVCAPSRSVLMTGKHTGRTTVRGNFGIGGVKGLAGGEGRVPLKEYDTTMAQILKDAGYVTGMVGKWGLGEPNTSGMPNKKGFDEFFGFLNQRRAHSYFPEYLWKDSVKVLLNGNNNGQKQEYTHDKFADFAVDFISRNADTSFFLYVPLCLPHDEYEVPDYGDYENEEWGEELKAYASMVSRMDNTVGCILKTLKEKGIDENTIVFFTSDNGATKIAGEWKMFKSNAPLKGEKRDAYEGGIRVPMIVRYPGKIDAGKTNDLAWYFADMMPTLSELTNSKSPVDIDGNSVLPTLMGEKQDFSNRYMYWEFYEQEGWRAVRFGKWKAVQNGMKNNTPKAIELYDLESDIDESDDLAKHHPEIIEKVKSMFDEAHTPSQHYVWK